MLLGKGAAPAFKLPCTVWTSGGGAGGGRRGEGTCTTAASPGADRARPGAPPREGGWRVGPPASRRLGPLAAARGGVIAREGVDGANSTAPRDRRALTWLRWRRRLPVPFVVTRHTMPLTLMPELIAVGLSADRTIAVSPAVALALRRRLHPRARLRVVPNGIDCERVDAPPSDAELAAARAALGDPAGRPVVLVLARRKDQHILLQGLAALQRAVLVACVGIEPDPELRAIEGRVPAQHRVVYVPFTDRPLAFARLAGEIGLR